MKLTKNLFLFRIIKCLILIFIFNMPLISQNYSAIWERIYPKSSPLMRFNSAMINLGKNKVLMFGGDYLGDSIKNGFNDTWIFDLTDTSWTQISTKFSPSPRYGHDMLKIDLNTIFLYGGVSNDRDNYQRDVWFFDIVKQEWKQVLKDTSGSPPEMIWWPMCHINKDTILVYGWDVEFIPYHFYYSISQNKWFRDTQYRYVEPVNGAKFVNLNSEIMFTFGGFNINGGYKNKTWKMNKKDLFWQQIFPKNSPRVLVDYSMFALDTSSVIVYGGLTDDSCSTSGKLWLYENSLNNWFDISPNFRPKNRAGQSMAQLNDSTFIMFSGATRCKEDLYFENDTWILHIKKNTSDVINNALIPAVTYKEFNNEIVICDLALNDDVKIYNLVGVLNNVFNVNSYSLRIRKSDFEQGIYFIQVNSKNNISNHKFIGTK